MARILFFGRLRDIAGASREVVLAPDTRTLAALRAQITANDDDLARALSAPGVRVAIDQCFAGEATPVRQTSEVAFMPPMSGG